ncbi:CidA/LrgA family protein [Alphaproteobacteria bacterium]|jgi:holin-like protein|nr:CidA/LrgA family protein [Alphaproteobacteria bacterium]MDB2478077.1 CidA/LrgA family protein [Alphaproteobacteria bacterium]MDB2583982.1 CidA/LrgA family protein [Alphaproteobacteria bacterium]MDB2683303.1 CidA/LrgA family protein [Alphaproteobacteria bacterium]MDC6452379.1 CidA/LrgA family protein [Alphaproteobacteria bacterium]
MLNSIFTIFLFQLVGEFIQKFLEISIPGPVIGLILLLTVLLIKNKYFNASTNFQNDLIRSCESLLNYLPLLFIPVGVGVVMHLTLLEDNLISVITIIILGTLLTLAITGFIMEKLLKEDEQK